MEISKENIFKMQYTSAFVDEKVKKKKWTSRLVKFIKNNKIISITLAVFFLCVSLNFILMYNFMIILENMQKC